MTKKIILIRIIFSLLSFSCKKENWLIHYYPQKCGWATTDSINVELNDQIEGKKLCLRMRYNDNFLYENIYMRVRLRAPEFDTTFLYNFSLFDAFGQPLSDTTGGTRTEIIFPNLEKKAANSTLTIAPYMRTDTLLGIAEVSMGLF